MNNDCQRAGIYKATLPDGKFYIGSTIDFKKRYGTHKYSFNNIGKRKGTALSAYIWDNKTDPSDPTPPITWEMIAEAPPYRKGGRYCDLCLTEKMIIAKGFGNPNQLNRRTDIALKCKHRAKHKLKKNAQEDE